MARQREWTTSGKLELMPRKRSEWTSLINSIFWIVVIAVVGFAWMYERDDRPRCPPVVETRQCP